MNFHEYQAKRLFEDYDIPVPAGEVADSVEAAVVAAEKVGGNQWVVKAQVHAGGRGKAGGVKLVQGIDELKKAADRMLGMTISTYQSAGEGLPVNEVLIAEAVDIKKEIYLSALVDRANRCVTFMGSSEGGVEIEKTAEENPDAIVRIHVDNTAGLQDFQCRQMAFGMGMRGKHVKQLTQIMKRIYRLMRDKDLTLVEVNPLIIDGDKNLMALDAKINADDNALFRHPDLEEMRDISQEDATEAEAKKHDLNYVTLDGDIACMVNGAGLAMATMDVVKLAGGEPANFLDVGGGTDAERVEEAFKLILAGPNVKAILVNIFGGIVRCDLIAEGVINAVKEVGIDVPVVVRLEGTNVKKGKKMLADSGLDIIAADDLNDAANKAVKAAA